MRRQAKESGWRRHLDGWQAGLVVLLLAGSAILLVMPRAVEPAWIPAVEIDDAALAATEAADDARARRAATGELDVDVRALGRELRAYNGAAARGDAETFESARAAVAHAAVRAWAVSPEQVLELRAYQLARFLAELRAWQASGSASDELAQTGGDLVDMLARNAWCRPGSRALVFGESTVRVLFKKRWTGLTGLAARELEPTREEEQVRLGLLVQHPFRKHEAVSQLATSAALSERQLVAARLTTIDRLEALDPSYPADLARGVVLYRSGQLAPAIESLRKHLELRPDGPLTLRARNYLKAALERAGTAL